MNCRKCGVNKANSGRTWCEKCYRASLVPTQGMLLCQICNNRAHPGSPGCSRTHAQMAIAKGLYHPR